MVDDPFFLCLAPRISTKEPFLFLRKRCEILPRVDILKKQGHRTKKFHYYLEHWGECITRNDNIQMHRSSTMLITPTKL